MLLDLSPPKRRIDRHRDAVGVQGAEEGCEEAGLSGQHESDALAWLHAPLQQAGRYAARCLVQSGIGDQLLSLLRITPEPDVRAIAMSRGMRPKRRDQSRGPAG